MITYECLQLDDFPNKITILKLKKKYKTHIMHFFLYLWFKYFLE